MRFFKITRVKFPVTGIDGPALFNLGFIITANRQNGGNMSAKLNLLPLPQSISLAGGTFQLPENGSIVVNVPQPGALAFTAQQAQKALAEYARVNWNITSNGN